MTFVRLISALLALSLAPAAANALTVQNVSVTETGGVSVSSGASVKGTEDAEASVKSFVTGQGENAHVRVDIQTSAGGNVETSSFDKMVAFPKRVDLHVATTLPQVGKSPTAPAKVLMPVSSSTAELFSRLSSILEKLLRAVSFWR